MKINNFQGDLADISAKEEALIRTLRAQVMCPVNDQESLWHPKKRSRTKGKVNCTLRVHTCTAQCCRFSRNIA